LHYLKALLRLKKFSGLNNNENKLRDRQAVCSLEAIIKSSEHFPGDFEANQRLTHLHGKARKTFVSGIQVANLVLQKFRT